MYSMEHQYTVILHYFSLFFAYLSKKADCIHVKFGTYFQYGSIDDKFTQNFICQVLLYLLLLFFPQSCLSWLNVLLSRNLAHMLTWTCDLKSVKSHVYLQSFSSNMGGCGQDVISILQVEPAFVVMSYRHLFLRRLSHYGF